MAWHVYLLECADTTLYCGITRHLERRVRQHNGLLAGGARYTRGRRPVSLIAAVACASQGEALRLEALIKRTPRNGKVALLLAWETKESATGCAPAASTG